MKEVKKKASKRPAEERTVLKALQNKTNKLTFFSTYRAANIKRARHCWLSNYVEFDEEKNQFTKQKKTCTTTDNESKRGYNSGYTVSRRCNSVKNRQALIKEGRNELYISSYYSGAIAGQVCRYNNGEPLSESVEKIIASENQETNDSPYKDAAEEISDENQGINDSQYEDVAEETSDENQEINDSPYKDVAEEILNMYEQINAPQQSSGQEAIVPTENIFTHSYPSNFSETGIFTTSNSIDDLMDLETVLNSNEPDKTKLEKVVKLYKNEILERKKALHSNQEVLNINQQILAINQQLWSVNQKIMDSHNLTFNPENTSSFGRVYSSNSPFSFLNSPVRETPETLTQEEDMAKLSSFLMSQQN